MDAIRVYIEKIRKTPLLTAKEEKELARKARKGNKSAKRKLITANLRLVISIAKHYTRYGMPLMDLIEEGNLGLIKAVDKFMPSKGFRFSTYAAWWIRQSITRALINLGKTIRVPVYMSENIAKFKKTQERLRQKYGRNPTRGEIAKSMKIPKKKIAELEMWVNKKASLDAPIGEDKTSQLVDLIKAGAMEDKENAIEKFYKHDEILKLLSNLSEREKNILDLRFGVNDGASKTLAEVAKRCSVSKERVRQIEARALKKLRKLVKVKKDKYR